MRKIFNTTILFFGFALFPGCEKEIAWNFQSELNESVIVDGIVTNEKKRHEIRLSTPHTELNALPNPYTNATVVVNDGDTNYVLQEEQAGTYRSDSVRALYGKTYTLIIIRDGDTTMAEAEMVPITPFIAPSYSLKDSIKNLYGMDWIARDFSSNEPAMWNIFLDWSEVPGYQLLPADSTHAKLVHYTLSTVEISQIFAPDKEEILFPLGTKITKVKYALSDEHADFVASLLSETEWKGGFFDSAPSNVKTNVSNGGMGFFGACMVKSKEYTVY